MNNKYTFWELCNTYNKIEVPIIQRDYAQGRNTEEVQKLRSKFVNDFLIDSVLNDEKIELDFVYGSILTETKGDEKQKVFIPLDGQQRLTTLFLLHFFVALKVNRLPEIKEVLVRFKYETRPSAHDFCEKLLKISSIKNLSNIKAEIQDSVWYNDEWKNDPTIVGMLNMLDSFAKNEKLLNTKEDILDKLLNIDNPLISFYFTDLDQFGLTENLYIRMNARGKMLTDFENFKSEFSKIIRYSHSLLEDVKDKIEYKWVDNLWDYRAKDSYIIDSPFMTFLSFITEMLYYKDSEFRAKSYESNFLDLGVLKTIYSAEENLKFLIFSLDYIADIKKSNEVILWEGESLHTVLRNIINNRGDTNQFFVLFLVLQYCYQDKPKENLFDFIRVVRNLIENTNDNSRREWSRLISSLQNLIADNNVYEILAKMKDEEKLKGFDLDQRKEEIFKAKLIEDYPEYKSLIFEIEDNKNFKGNITNILLTPIVDSEEMFEEFKIDSILYDDSHFDILQSVFNGYKEISINDFKLIWGNFLATTLYTKSYESRYIYSYFYEKHPAVLMFAKKFAMSKRNLLNYIEQLQKKYILKLNKRYKDMSEIKNVGDQLYLYYILSERLYEQSFEDFFKNDNLNFGWLKKETGYKSLFSNGINVGDSFSNVNPIYQLYNQQFRYSMGISSWNTLEIEIVGGNKKRNPFELIVNWAKEK
jgi:hypothetical protein